MNNYQEIRADQLRSVVTRVLESQPYVLTAMFANDERNIKGSFAVYCIFVHRHAPDFVVIKAILGPDESEFPSIVPVTPAAAWYEREIHDLFGLKPIGHPDLRPLVLHENWPEGVYPLRKDFNEDELLTDGGRDFLIPKVAGEGVFEVPVGPIHAGIIEPGHFRFSQAGENVINLEAKLFFTHRGIEKAVEGLAVDQAFYQIERVCGACTVSHALNFAQNVEKLSNADITARADYLRALAAELERLYNHVGDVGNLCAGVGFAVGVSNGARLKELLLRFNEKLAGNRFLRGLIVPGGVNHDISAELAHELKDTLSLIDREFKELADLLRENEAFLDRVNTTGVLTHQTALDLAVVGVAARASGINGDTRRDQPYSVYNKLNFKVPVYNRGDVAARLWVRVDETFQSISLIRQIIGGMPSNDGTLAIKLPELPAYQTVFSWNESARGSNLHWLMTGEHNTVYRYFIRSASYSNWLAVPSTVPGNIIPDFPLINKSFELCYACIDR